MLEGKIKLLREELKALADYETYVQESRDAAIAEHDEELGKVIPRSKELRIELKELEAELKAQRLKDHETEARYFQRGRRSVYPWYLLQEQGDFFTVSSKSAVDLRPHCANYQSRLGKSSFVRAIDIPGGCLVVLAYIDEPIKATPSLPPKLPVPKPFKEPEEGDIGEQIINGKNEDMVFSKGRWITVDQWNEEEEARIDQAAQDQEDYLDTIDTTELSSPSSTQNQPPPSHRFHDVIDWDNDPASEDANPEEGLDFDEPKF